VLRFVFTFAPTPRMSTFLELLKNFALRSRLIGRRGVNSGVARQRLVLLARSRFYGRRAPGRPSV
jgi:hypothetical protein